MASAFEKQIAVAARLVTGVLFLGLLLAAPAAAQGVTPYYCSTADVLADGTGSATAPWLCQTDDELQAVLNTVCVNGGGVLYRSFSESYLEYTVTPAVAGQCNITVREGPGSPPTAGVMLPAATALSLAAALGLICLIAGLALRFLPPVALSN